MNEDQIDWSVEAIMKEAEEMNDNFMDGDYDNMKWRISGDAWWKEYVDGTKRVPALMEDDGSWDGIVTSIEKTKGDNEMEEITIKKVMNGFIVEVGCETLVFNDIVYMLLELKTYLLNPKAMRRAYIKKYRSGHELNETE